MLKADVRAYLKIISEMLELKIKVSCAGRSSVIMEHV
jgi:hypothetical protein